MKKFIECAKSYRMDDQMQKLNALNFFTKKELREGLKRKIHLTYFDN